MKYTLDKVAVYKWCQVLHVDFWFPKIRQELVYPGKKNVDFGIRSISLWFCNLASQSLFPHSHNQDDNSYLIGGELNRYM